MSELRTLMRSTRRFRLALLALVLLLAQTGALVHSYSHDAAGTQHRGALSNERCGLCLAATPLLGGNAGLSQWLALADFLALVICVLSVRQIFAFRFQHPAFRSRAPPRP